MRPNSSHLKCCNYAHNGQLFIKIISKFVYFSTVCPDVAASVNLKKMESSIYKAKRNNMCAKIPNDFAEFGELIESAGERFHIHGSPFLSSIVGEDGDKSMIFIIHSLLDLLTAAPELHIDGTFKCLPDKPNSSQLLVIMVMHRNHVSITFRII